MRSIVWPTTAFPHIFTFLHYAAFFQARVPAHSNTMIPGAFSGKNQAAPPPPPSAEEQRPWTRNRSRSPIGTIEQREASAELLKFFIMLYSNCKTTAQEFCVSGRCTRRIICHLRSKTWPTEWQVPAILGFGISSSRLLGRARDPDEPEQNSSPLTASGTCANGA